MNVFVLCTGRCGSTAFAKACGHMINFTAAHESRAGRIGDDRLAYPDNHIEADYGLSWQLGRLDATYGDGARYVHLIRDPVEAARSWSERFALGAMMSAYRSAILSNDSVSREASAADFVDLVTANIRLFLKDKRNVVEVRVERVEQDFPQFWAWVGARGSLEAAMAEWRVGHNRGTFRKPPVMGVRDAVRRAIRAVIPPP